MPFWEPQPFPSLEFEIFFERGLKGERDLTRSQPGSNPAPAPIYWFNMKIRIAWLMIIFTFYGFIGAAEAGIFADILDHFKINVSKGAGQIPVSAFIILLATGIVGILGIRRRGKKP